jgi:hypothetical protein
MAGKWSQFLPELKGITLRSGSCVVGISQLRKKIETGGFPGKKPSGDGTITQGGEAWKFYSEVRIGLKRIGQEKGKIFSIIENKWIEDVVKSQILIKIDKCKMAASQGMSAKFFIHHGEGIDDMRSIIDIAVAHGILQRDGGGWHVFERGNGEIVKVKGVDAFKNGLKSHPGAWEELYQVTLERLAKVAKDTSVVVEDFDDPPEESAEELGAKDVQNMLDGMSGKKKSEEEDSDED